MRKSLCLALALLLVSATAFAEYTRVINGRFGFSLVIPAQFHAEDSSENGDGFIITNQPLDMRAYGGIQIFSFGEEYYLEIMAEQYDSIDSYQFEDGIYGYIMRNDTEVLYVRVSEECEANFYVNFAADPEWYIDSPDLFDSIARTLSFPD